MGAVYRLATLDDASRLYEIRRQSILELGPPGISSEEATTWATKLTLSGMERKLRDFEIWVAEQEGSVAGWGAIRGDYLEGLYTSPEYAGCGVGGKLLGMLEALMRTRGIAALRAEASSNARDFYLRRGYALTGPQTVGRAWPIAKQIC